MLSSVNREPWRDTAKELSSLICMSSAGRLRHWGLLPWGLQGALLLQQWALAVQGLSSTQRSTVSLPTQTCFSLEQFWDRVSPVRNLTMSSFPQQPKRKVSGKFQRADFQQVPPAWHHSNFSDIQWDIIVPSLTKSVSQPLGTFFWVLCLSLRWSSSDFCSSCIL